ncbi:hypothetical protein TVAG_349550 [Trichomonas vaginalis G3]|nr:radial spoke protein 3 family [Trichomonas vaginalis G3]EAY06102.1 hypothetical protein TVAG_349550 [Trichomonas vaginalis G3]KAI5497154.1 radial spoke protein 3 family [Trichomonas vaginalis G3]|eukprot:XP_001318325.1 hypothetical protein [Trichomonas vaginalis G3]
MKRLMLIEDIMAHKIKEANKGKEKKEEKHDEEEDKE